MLNKLLYLLYILLALGQFTVLVRISGGKIYAYDIALLAFVIYGVLSFLILKKEFFLSKFLTPFYLFTFFAILSLVPAVSILPREDLLLAFSYLLRWIFYLSAATVLFNMLKSDRNGIKALVNIFTLSGLFISIVGFVQLIFLPDFTVLDASLGWDPHRNRLASTFFDPNFTGIYLVLVMALFFFRKELISIEPTVKASMLYKKYAIFFFITMFLALFLTYSRSSWGAFGILVFIYGLKYSRKLIFISLVIAFLAYFAVPRIQTRISGITDPSDSAYFRFISWENTYDIASDNLLLGVGYNTFRSFQIEYGFLTPETQKEHSSAGSDSSLLLILATTGIFGFLSFFLGFLYPAVFSIFKKGHVFLTAVFLVLMLHSQFVNSLLYPQIMFMWLCYFVFMETAFYKLQK